MRTSRLCAARLKKDLRSFTIRLSAVAGTKRGQGRGTFVGATAKEPVQPSRVLDRDGAAVGPWSGLLNDEELLEGLRHMMILRAFDARMVMAQRQGKTSFYMQHMGEEAVSCAVRKALLPGDMNFPTYRQAGLLIAGGHSLEDMMCQIYSNERDPLKGRQMPVHYSFADLKLFSVSSPIARPALSTTA